MSHKYKNIILLDLNAIKENYTVESYADSSMLSKILGRP